MNLRSLRSRWILASILWTSGLLLLMHLFSVLVVHAFPAVRGRLSVGAVIIGLGLMAAGFVAVRRSLKPFGQLRTMLTAVRTGETRRVEGTYPTEVQPLVDELNALLEERELAVQRAHAAAGDLAHGLKTPLALLSQEVEQAPAIRPQVERMSRLVDYHLARARAAAVGKAVASRCPLRPSVEALVRTLSKLQAERPVAFSVQVSAELFVKMPREDLDEVLGNVLENANKWARGQVRVQAALEQAIVTITAEDDGPGIAPALRQVVLERGVRADEAAPGHGLGLAIVRDLAELYGGSIALDESALGGLRVRLCLPGGAA